MHGGISKDLQKHLQVFEVVLFSMQHVWCRVRSMGGAGCTARVVPGAQGPVVQGAQRRLRQ